MRGKGSLLWKMPGDEWQKSANLRLLRDTMFVQPGKKRLFQGAEVAHGDEWRHGRSVDWQLLQYAPHEGVRRWLADLNAYRAEPALHGIEAAHVDGLRLDAVHAIFDTTPQPFLRQLGDAVPAAGWTVLVFPETHANDPQLVRGPERGGMGLDAAWADDLHHAVHVLLTGERHGCYTDYGTVDHLARALRRAFGYAGERLAAARLGRRAVGRSRLAGARERVGHRGPSARSLPVLAKEGGA